MYNFVEVAGGTFDDKFNQSKQNWQKNVILFTKNR